MNEYAHKPLKGLLPDIQRTPVNRDGGHESKNFNRFTRSNVSNLDSPQSAKVFITPLKEQEKQGWRFGQRSRSMMDNY